MFSPPPKSIVVRAIYVQFIHCKCILGRIVSLLFGTQRKTLFMQQMPKQKQLQLCRRFCFGLAFRSDAMLFLLVFSQQNTI